MYKDKKILSLLPARGGSKGLPGKNIKTLLEKPLVAWTIAQAKKSKCIDEILVSTDDRQIAEVAQQYGAKPPFLRPSELADDNSPIIDTILHALGWFEQKGISFEYVALLEPTSPLRKKDDLDKAIKTLIDNEDKADSLVSVGEVHLENPYITKLIIDGYVRPLIGKGEDGSFQRQQLPKVYFPYGVIYISKVAALKDKRTFYQEKTIPYFIERWQNYEIDDIWDFLCIEAILKDKLKDCKK